MKSLITAIDSSIEKIENGSIELTELETMVNQSRELYERLVVLRYKVYADSVLGTKTPLVDKEVVDFNAPIVEEIQVEETSFDFSLFDETSNEDAITEHLEEESIELNLEIPAVEMEEKIDETQAEPVIQTVVEPEISEIPSTTEPFSLFTETAPALTIEDVQPEIETEKKPVPVSNFEEVKFPTSVFANSPIDEVLIEEPLEDKSPEVISPIIETPYLETTIMETTESYIAPVTEPVSNVNQNASTEHPLSVGLKAIEANVRNKNSIAPLDTLIGSFSLNEKLTLINELFDGSSDEFSSSIKRLDSQVNLESAHSILADMAERHSWDLESETTEELIFKICRRYANNASN